MRFAIFARNMRVMRTMVVVRVTETTYMLRTHSSNQRAQTLRTLSTLPGLTSMPAPTTRAQWVSLLAEKGTVVPDSWSVMQMKAHLAELQQKDQPISNGEMEVRIKALKKASNHRADLVNFLTKEGIPYSQHATIAQLYAKGEQAITEDYEPQGKELMGFGKFGGLTMEEVMDRHPSYMKWVVDTYQETDQFHWRLKRAAVYAMQAQAKKDYQEPHPQNTKSKKAIPHISAAGSDGSFEKVSEGKHEFSPTQSFQKTKHVSTDAETQIAELQLKIQQLENEKAEMELQAARSKNRKEM